MAARAAIGYPSIGQMFVVVDANGEIRREREGEWEPVALAEEGELLGLSTEGDWLVGAGGVVLARHAVGDGEFGDGAVVRADVADVEVGTHGCLQLAGGRPFAVDVEDRVAAPTRREDWAERIAVDELPAEPRARLAAQAAAARRVCTAVSEPSPGSPPGTPSPVSWCSPSPRYRQGGSWGLARYLMSDLTPAISRI